MVVGPLLLAAIVVGCTAPSPSPSRTPAASLPAPSASPTAIPEPVDHRIGVRVVDGAGEFYDRLTGDRFVPRGSNLIRLGGYHNTFNPSSYDRDDLDAQLARMADGGYNVVRVFHDHGSGGLGGNDSTLSAYMDNVAEFLRAAKAHGLFVIFAQDWLPDNRYGYDPDPGIEGINSLYLSAGGVAANARFFGDFVDALIARGAPLDAVWAYELRNELYFEAQEPPFNATSGQVTTANGVTYDLADAAERARLLEDGLVYWIDQVRAAIIERDPTALVTVGFFQPQTPNPTRIGDTRLIETEAAILRSTADFIDFHAYPGGDLNLRQLVENYKLPPMTDKPIVLGEFGAFHEHYPTAADAVQALISWQAESCEYGFDGSLLWTWDSAGGYAETWNGTDGDAALANALAPANRPDPCSFDGGLPLNLALERSVTASGALADGPAAAAVDGALGTGWNSGDGPVQWIEIDLGEAVAVGEIRLVVGQFPAGRTEHRVYGRAAPGAALVLLHTFSGDTSDGDVLSVVLPSGGGAVRMLRVETVTSPSWVAWREIEVISAR